ncbi:MULTISPECIES: type IV pilin [Haloferax]|uniref:Flagellin-like protein n=2 Tax=Haloferax volcanii TaxID=2246 RepID=M0I8J9_HALVO|nr:MULTISPECIES: type IV pilin N-terminal domain-containing protein [Haloferax]ELZ73507.1 flagellin-like protein [Haloferax lucentense DSM 14919]ELZ92168.1 flagellin-like protein [Haloferax alexandrinus JCM 10717]RDZ37438.1 type IV pilin [Haloferax sp. Atlit-24N]RLM38234.1 type IV pilin [Haloferax sp. Atlit-109R]RLM46175.1 type IV pilin [Haloferax sp. Atlit-105R]
MKLKQLFEDDDAVSPVIGVILMVAITVILAAVIGTFVLGLGEQTATAPQASFSFDYNQSAPDHLNITHESGQAINSERLSISTGVDIYDPDEAATNASDSRTWTSLNGYTQTDVTAGTSVTIRPVSSETLADQTVRIVWTDEAGSSSATLQRWSGPNA